MKAHYTGTDQSLQLLASWAAAQEAEAHSDSPRLAETGHAPSGPS